MPYINLMVAQGVSAWVAAPFLVGSVLTEGEGGVSPYFFHIVAAVGALLIWLTGYVGSRISRAIRRPTLMTLAVTVAFAVAGSVVATSAFSQGYSPRSMGELFIVMPVAAAILGYMLARGAEQA